MFQNKFLGDIVEGVQDVFTTMIMMEVSPQTASNDKDVDIRSNITSMIGLGGDISGMLAVHCSDDFAKEITGQFLGMDVAEIDEDVKDAVGEIANMIAGNLKISYASREKKIQLAIPTTIVGESFKVSGFAGAEGGVIPFISKGGEFWIELKYRNN